MGMQRLMPCVLLVTKATPLILNLARQLPSTRNTASMSSLITVSVIMLFWMIMGPSGPLSIITLMTSLGASCLKWSPSPKSTKHVTTCSPPSLLGNILPLSMMSLKPISCALLMDPRLASCLLIAAQRHGLHFRLMLTFSMWKECVFAVPRHPVELLDLPFSTCYPRNGTDPSTWRCVV